MRQFTDIAPPRYRRPSPIRTVIVADFDNDGNLEIFQNNIVYRRAAPNNVFRVLRNENGGDPQITQIPIGDARELYGYGTGGAVADLDGDGVLELMLAHGESSRQPLTMYRAKTNGDENWLRVMPKTEHGAPARGALVVARTTDNVAHLRVIDGGSGYLCQMEPFAHFGLGDAVVDKIEITWPSGVKLTRNISQLEMRTLVVVEYPRNVALTTGEFAIVDNREIVGEFVGLGQAEAELGFSF
ncbi:cartilage acidic protein 1-like [Ptychodera flava]|uniref:cartilage acidic protein 1-like n=1 Tax=Ptychodera flava TaxID=63121 RepID=UPI00396A0D15